MVNLEIKNRALLAKWCWRFAVEKEVLWRKVILAKCGFSFQHWQFRANKVKEMSSIWRVIMENSKDSRVEKWMGHKEFRRKIGNGKPTMFWVDVWCENKPLKVEFPRLYRLVKIKNGLVTDYSNNNGFNNVKWEDYFYKATVGWRIEGT